MAVLLVLWQGAVSLGLFASAILPGPIETLVAGWDWIFGADDGLYSGTWPEAAMVTTARVFIGFVLASLAGIVIGILIGYFRPLAVSVDPVVQVLRPIPAVAWVPLAVVLFGFSPTATIFLILYGTFFPVVLNTAAGVQRSQTRFLQVGTMIGASRLQMLRHIVLPAALPSIFTGLRLGIGTAWILAIVGEMIAVRSGLGYSLLNAYTVFRYDIVIAGMVSFGVLGFLSDRLVIALEHRILRWRKGYDVASS